MTQKEYNEEIEKYKKIIEELEFKKQDLEVKLSNYEQVLEKYFVANNGWQREKEYNDTNNRVIQEQQEIIEKYKAILDKFTFNSN